MVAQAMAALSKFCGTEEFPGTRSQSFALEWLLDGFISGRSSEWFQAQFKDMSWVRDNSQ